MNSNIWVFVTWAAVIWVLVTLGLVTEDPSRNLFRTLAVSMTVTLVLSLAVAGFLLVVTL